MTLGVTAALPNHTALGSAEVNNESNTFFILPLIMKKGREYCCCAIPLVNAGIYLTLTEQLFGSLLVGILSVATPSIVGASTPSIAPVILAILCFVITVVQVLGFIGVAKEKTIMYRRYVTLHGLALGAVFFLAGIWIGLSAAGHSKAEAKCIQDFFNSTGSASDSSEGEALCSIFSWVDIGIMGALWVMLAVLQVYLFFVLSSYGRTQRQDHDQYARLYDPTQPLTAENIPLGQQVQEPTDPWDPSDRDHQYGAHLKNRSVDKALPNI